MSKDSYFTVGMFLVLEVLMKQPIKDTLMNLPLSEEIKSAILEYQGAMGETLVCATAIEKAQWSKIGLMDLGHNEIAVVYRQTIERTDSVMRQF